MHVSGQDTVSPRNIVSGSGAKIERRFFFNLDQAGEISSTVGGIGGNTRVRPVSAVQTRSKYLPQAASQNRRPISASAISGRDNRQADFLLPEDRSSSSKQSSSQKLKVQLSYYSVLINEDEVNGPPIDYSRDFRRFAYRDFAFEDYKPGANICPEQVLEWVVKAKPRNQDDFYPIMQLCKGVLSDLMRGKLTCRFQSENVFLVQIAELQDIIKAKGQVENDLKLEIERLKDKLAAKGNEVNDVQDKVRVLESTIMLQTIEISDFKTRIQDINSKEMEAKRQLADLEKKLRSATVIAEQRTSDYVRAHNSLSARMKMTVPEIVSGWTSEQKYESLKEMLQDARSPFEKLQSHDFYGCSAELRRNLTKRLLDAIKVSSSSWLIAVSELFDCEPKNLYPKVASWYESEGIMTDSVKFQKDVERLKTIIEGTDYAPIYDVMKQAIILGKMTVSELVFSCSSQSEEATMQSLTGMTLEEVDIFKKRRKEILQYVQTKNSNAAKEKQDHAKKKDLGFLHFNICPADPMDIPNMNALIAKIFARKIAKDIDHVDDGKKRMNIMKVTKNMMLDIYKSTADIKLQISKLVHGINAHQRTCPRARVFAILAGMDPSKSWFERASGFVMEFIATVVEEISADAATLTNFRKQNNLLPLRLMPPNTDRIEWTLMNHDFKVPLHILLKAAYHACEGHPCGYGYPRDRIQEVVERASAPPKEYTDVQKEKIRQGKEKLEDMRRQQVFDRLSSKPRERRLDGDDVALQSRDAEMFSIKPDNGSRQRDLPSAIDILAIAVHNKSGSHAKGIRSGRRLSMSASPPPPLNRGEGSPTNKVLHDYGVACEPHWKAWFDVFCQGLLEAWFDQHTILEAQMSHIFDVFDADGSGSIEFEEFKHLMSNSPMANKFSEKQLMHMFEELTSHDGLLTKHDWQNLFHHVQFDVLAMIRPRQDAVRRKLIGQVSDRLQLEDLDSDDLGRRSDDGDDVTPELI